MPRLRVLAIGLFVFSLLLAPPARADDGDFGYAGPSFSGAGTNPTEHKPESKLWWNDGSWWASLFSPTVGAFTIHRLDTSVQQWVDTGVRLDARAGSTADVLWHQASGKLYVASQGSGGAWLFRYSYGAATKTYVNDAGAGTSNRLATITSTNPETITIDRDSTGQLWATWEDEGEVRVNRSTTNDATWGTEFTLPVAQATGLDGDDISAVVAFDGDKIGVMWSHQAGNRMHFAVHQDAAPDTTWEASMVAFGGGGQPDADDHINLKALQADPNSDRLFAAIKTSRSSGPEPLVVLLRYDRSEGWWDSAVFGIEDEDHTRPVIMLDTTNRLVHMFATAPTQPEPGAPQTIYCKVTSIDAPRNGMSFPGGFGEPVLRDISHDINDATVSKQNVSAATGLVVLGASSAGRYWHHYNSLTSPGCHGVADPGGGASLPPAPSGLSARAGDGEVSLSWDPVAGATGYRLSRSTSSGGPYTEIASPSTPGHVDPGLTNGTTYYYVVSAVNDAGMGPASVEVSATPGGEPGGGVTVTASHDSYVRSNAPSENNGTASTLRAYRKGGNETRSYLQFSVSGLAAPGPATLRLWVTKSSPDGGVLHTTAGGWSESTLTWTTSPPLGTELAALGSVSAGSWIELPVGTLGNGTHSFAIEGRSSTVAYYSSAEASNPPELVIAAGGGDPGG